MLALMLSAVFFSLWFNFGPVNIKQHISHNHLWKRCPIYQLVNISYIHSTLKNVQGWIINLLYNQKNYSIYVCLKRNKCYNIFFYIKFLVYVAQGILLQIWSCFLIKQQDLNWICMHLHICLWMDSFVNLNTSTECLSNHLCMARWICNVGYKWT